jgi:hypothetical protein
MVIGMKIFPMLTVAQEISKESAINESCNSETPTPINSPSVKPEMKFNAR